MPEIEPVGNAACKQEANYTLKCGHVLISWICNDCVVHRPVA